MKGLSAKQQAILDFLRQFIRDKDYPPSIRDIQLGCDISSTSVVDYNLKALERLGYIRRDREVSRAIELLDGSGRRPHTVAVPLVGTIAAGSPIPVFNVGEPPEETVDATEEMIKGKENVFALRVKGTSMIDAMVNDGDIVILEETHSADDGDMVAAWLKDEEATTLKQIYTDGDRIRLQPRNVTIDPIYKNPEDIEVQGRVLAVISQYS